MIVGRQVLGEAPTVFYLLAGYASVWGALRRRAWLILLAVIFFAVALRVKAQVPPFWMVSMLLPFAVAVYRRWSRVVSCWRSLSCSYLTANYDCVASRHINCRAFSGWQRVQVECDCGGVD
jgi:hypothetical protein